MALEVERVQNRCSERDQIYKNQLSSGIYVSLVKLGRE